MSMETDERKDVLFTQEEVDILDKVGKYKQYCWGIYYNTIDPQQQLEIVTKEVIRIVFLSGISSGMAFEPRGDNKHLYTENKEGEGVKEKDEFLQYVEKIIAKRDKSMGEDKK